MYYHPFFVRFAVDDQFDRALRETERGHLLSIVRGEARGRGNGFLARWLPSRRVPGNADSSQSRPRRIPSSKPQEQCC